MLFKRVFLFSIIVLFTIISKGQKITTSDTLMDDTKILLRKEKSGFIMIHTSGFGFGYHSGKHVTGYKKRMFEIELTGIRDQKAIKTSNLYFQDSKSYIYGQENSFFIIRSGYGKQKIINSKPYWGGVELRYFYYGGVSLGILKPVYLYILNETNTQSITVEKYDPNKDNYDNIYGKAPFFTGFTKINFDPGLYFKTGLNIEYGSYDKILKAIEIGAAVDAYLKPVPLMAFNPSKNIFTSLFLSFHFGKRGN